MTDKHALKQLLKRPDVPPSLQQNILANWQQQQAQRRRNTPLLFAWASSLAALVLTLLLLFKPNTDGGDLIGLALKDIASDAEKHVAIALPLDEVYLRAHIHRPPPSMPVQMSKYCYLNDNKTMHLKVAGAKQGVVHLFIKQGDFDAVFSGRSTGAGASLPWRLFKPRNDLSVLVLYSRDMNPNSVDELLKTMFYA